MPLVAIIGKANVGKSTLFNRIAGKRQAIESATAGTTRDRNFTEYKGHKLKITFVDTGGIAFGKDNFEPEITKQAEMAIREADLILFCIDTKEDASLADEEVARFLRQKKGETQVYLLGTKADRMPSLEKKAEYYALGFAEEETFFISATHNLGVQKLLQQIEDYFLQKGYTNPETDDEDKITMALLGKPNVGKSSLINALLNEEKLIVSDVPGTTIDSVDLNLKYHQKDYVLIDTAGVRKQKKINKGVEKLSVLRTFTALKRADIALLLIDAAEGATHQDQVIMEQILDAKTGLIIVVNKWDEKLGGRFAHSEDEKEQARAAFIHHLQSKFSFVKWASVLFVSAQERKNITRLFKLADDICVERQKRVKTSLLNQFLAETLAQHSLKAKKNKKPPRVKFAQQVAVNPPHFVFYANSPENLHFSAKRYLENRLRETFGFNGTPMIVEFRQK